MFKFLLKERAQRVVAHVLKFNNNVMLNQL